MASSQSPKKWSYLIPGRTFAVHIEETGSVLVESQSKKVVFQRESQMLRTGTDPRRWQWHVVVKNGCLNFSNVFSGDLLQTSPNHNDETGLMLKTAKDASDPSATFCVGEESDDGYFVLYHNSNGQLDPISIAHGAETNTYYPILFDDVEDRRIALFKFELIKG